MPTPTTSVNYLPLLRVLPVHAALDWMWLVDIGQGNLIKAEISAREALEKSRNSDTLFARALVHQLQGEWKQALELFTEAFSLSTEVEHQYIIATLAYLAQLQRQEILADGFSLGDNHLEKPIASVWENRFQALQEKIEALPIQLIGEFVFQVSAQIPRWRSLLSRLTDESQKKEYVDTLQEQFTRQIELAQSLGEDKVSQALYLAMAEVLARAGELSNALAMIDELILVYHKSGNYIGIAQCLFSQADLIVNANSLGRPILFGYNCENSFVHKPLAELWYLFDRSNLEQANVHELYFNARQYFNTAGATRGEALTMMRMAYLDGVDSQWHLASLGYEEAKNSFLALGDNILATAAEMGRIWTCVHYDEPIEILLERVKEIAVSNRDREAISWGLSWAVAFAYTAMEALVTRTDIETALRSLSLAETIFSVYRPLEETTSVIEALPFKALMQSLYRHLIELFLAKDNHQQAFILADGLHSCSSFSLNFDALIDSVPEDTLVLVYLHLENKLIIWGLTNEKLVGHRIIHQWQEQSLSEELLAQISDDWLKQVSQGKIDGDLNNNLAELFLSGFSSFIDSAKQIIFVPCLPLNNFPFHILSWQEKPLAWQKSIGYLSSCNQLLIKNTKESLREEAMVFCYPGEVLSFAQGAAIFLAERLGSPLLVSSKITQELIDANLPSLIHIICHDKPIVEANLDLTGIVVIISYYNQNLSFLDSFKEHLSYAKTKAVIINVWQENELSNIMLLDFLQQNLRQKNHLGLSLIMAQQKLSQVTLQQALELCHHLQNYFPWDKFSDRPQRFIYTRYMGDLMAMAGDYSKAVEAYTVAINMLINLGHEELAESLKKIQQIYQDRENDSNKFNPDLLIFNSPQYWGNLQILGLSDRTI